MKAMNRLLTLCGVAAALLLPAPGDAAAADAGGDNVTIHYKRADSAYDGWGLHTWESFQKKEEAGDEFAAKQMSDRPLKGVTWFAPLKPSGKDDFGIFWTIPAKEFENGRVNYIIHKGDKKDQCNKDMFFMVKDSKDAWVVSGDCKVYMSKDDALKAPKK
jgi:hypothetical protein